MIKMGEFGTKINWGLGSILTWKISSSGICKTFRTTSLHLTHVSGPQERWLWASCLHEDCRNRRHRRSLASRRRLFGRRRIQPNCEHGFPGLIYTFVCSSTFPYNIIYQSIYSILLSTFKLPKMNKVIILFCVTSIGHLIAHPGIQIEPKWGRVWKQFLRIHLRIQPWQLQIDKKYFSFKTICWLEILQTSVWIVG